MLAAAFLLVAEALFYVEGAQAALEKYRVAQALVQPHPEQWDAWGVRSGSARVRALLER